MEQDYLQFVQSIKRKVGIDLNFYKEQQMKRRLTSLRARRGYSNFAEYYQALSQNSSLMNEMLDQMTINFSEFFRNPEKWQVLKNKVISEITTRNRNIRCWSAACSTGEEPYSLAMLLSEIGGITYTIHATDVDARALDKAKRGLYGTNQLLKVPKSLMQQHLQPVTANEYQVSDKLKQKIAFSKHNLLGDPYKTGFDLILCRNVMIYFKDDAKEQVIQRFSRSLNPGGYLFVGGTEHINNPAAFGLTQTSELFFYQKAGD